MDLCSIIPLLLTILMVQGSPVIKEDNNQTEAGNAQLQTLTRQLHEQTRLIAVQSERLRQLEAQAKRLEDVSRSQTPYQTDVVFSAVRTSSLGGVGKIIVCNQINVNIGNAYSSFSGIFRSPVAGVYMFSFGVLTKLGRDTDVSLRKGPMIVARGRWGDHSWHTGGQTVFLNVGVGEDFYLYLERGEITGGAGHIILSGQLLRPQ